MKRAQVCMAFDHINTLSDRLSKKKAKKPCCFTLLLLFLCTLHHLYFTLIFQTGWWSHGPTSITFNCWITADVRFENQIFCPPPLLVSFLVYKHFYINSRPRRWYIQPHFIFWRRIDNQCVGYKERSWRQSVELFVRVSYSFTTSHLTGDAPITTATQSHFPSTSQNIFLDYDEINT